ncbi:MAG: hypothetical protein HFH82_03745 [Lachnospiraceae bacterium]|nr:hypothetical protein [Lachnospiraceae bacterium]
MDEKFKAFEMWFLKRKAVWEQKGIFVEAAELSGTAHQYWIKVYSENGLGNIVLYESNGYYWVDFEAANYNLNLEKDAIFCKGNIEFENEQDLFRCEQEFIRHISRKE